MRLQLNTEGALLVIPAYRSGTRCVWFLGREVIPVLLLLLVPFVFAARNQNQVR